MPNPFIEHGMSAPIPERAQAKISEAINEAKQEVQAETDSLFGGNATEEIMNKSTWRDKCIVFGRQLTAIALEFIKRAIHLALAKFVLELCAMTIDAIMRALTKTGNHKMDITSPNVVYATPGQVPQQTSGGLFSRLAGNQPSSSSTMSNRAEDFHGPSVLGW